jgi:hypothetical protein
MVQQGLAVQQIAPGLAKLHKSPGQHNASPNEVYGLRSSLNDAAFGPIDATEANANASAPQTVATHTSWEPERCSSTRSQSNPYEGEIGIPLQLSGAKAGSGAADEVHSLAWLAHFFPLHQLSLTRAEAVKLATQSRACVAATCTKTPYVSAAYAAGVSRWTPGPSAGPCQHGCSYCWLPILLQVHSSSQFESKNAPPSHG